MINCLAKDRNGDETQPLENELNETKKCNSCKKELPISSFIGVKNVITKGCAQCREKNKISDRKRDKTHRNEIARKNDKKDERKAVKAKWNEENYDKVAKNWMDYRQRKIENLGTEEYLKKQAEQAKKWRAKNREKMDEVNENKKNSKEENYNVYKRSAEYKNLDFTISYDDYINIVDKECYYCGIIQDKGFNGIDRTNQTIGYLLDNCVSCCKICNYMKGSCNDKVFINRAEHILTFQNKISGNLYPKCFADYKGSSYDSYKNRALKKELEFVLTIDDYNNVTQRECFICGKESDNTHRNGIDRMDNSKGYILDNVNPCCGECNYMKKDYNFDCIMDKFERIYQKHKNEIKNELRNTIQYTNKHVVVNTNKKTKDEIKETGNIRKKNQREALKEKYADEEYKTTRAKELAERRLEKNN